MKKKIEVIINNLKVNAIVGIHPHEREKKQTLLLSVSFKYDAAAAIESDNIINAFDYENLSNEIIRTSENSSFNLIESLADKILKTVASHKEITEIYITLTKPGAIASADSVTVKLTS